MLLDSCSLLWTQFRDTLIITINVKNMFCSIKKYLTVNVHLNTSSARDGSTKLHFDKKKTPLSQVTIEQWGYASLNIMKELLRSGELADHDMMGYIDYTRCIFRLASNHIWHGVLYDMHATDGFKWRSPKKTCVTSILFQNLTVWSWKLLITWKNLPVMNNDPYRKYDSLQPFSK